MRFGYLRLVLVLALVLAALLGLLVGQFPLSVSQVLPSLVSGGAAGTAADVVLWELLLPRVMAAILVGAAVDAAGAT